MQIKQYNFGKDKTKFLKYSFNPNFRDILYQVLFKGVFKIRFCIKLKQYFGLRTSDILMDPDPAHQNIRDPGSGRKDIAQNLLKYGSNYLAWIRILDHRLQRLGTWRVLGVSASLLSADQRDALDSEDKDFVHVVQNKLSEPVDRT